MPVKHFAIAVCLLLVTGCTADPAGSPPAGPTPSPAPAAPTSRTVLPDQATTVIEGATAAELAVATSRALFREAPAVVLVADGDEASQAAAAEAAVRLGVPLLLTPSSHDTEAEAGQRSPGPGAPSPSTSAAPGAGAALRAELTRLHPQTLVTFGDLAARWTSAAADRGKEVVASGNDSAALPSLTPAPPLDALLVLARDQAASRAAVATARASGAHLLLVRQPDPRADDKVIDALSGRDVVHVLALGAEFGPADRLRRRIDTAAAGARLPGGGQVLFPGRRMVALYGHPGDPGLGCLGEQGLSAAIKRAKQVAASYRGQTDQPVVPAFEIIATVASASAGSDGNYSNEVPVSTLRPWVDAARTAGVYVVLDLQPGLTDFLTQAKRYAELLRQPHVGLALDPEWRLKPGQRHMEQIGSVSAAEINKTAAWLAGLTRTNHLPQKVLMLHQFRLDMITNRPSLDTGQDELAVVIHADGFGSAGQKFSTWNTMHINPPRRIWWGWKNFYDEDRPTFTPKQTMAVRPTPVFVSYQ